MTKFLQNLSKKNTFFALLFVYLHNYSKIITTFALKFGNTIIHSIFIW